jgi:hypothetical protein
VPVGATVNDNRVVMDDSRIGTNDSRVMLAVESTEVSHAYLPAANHQGRFTTLLRKASRLCQAAEAEIYMLIRIDGRFYVYNSVDPTSHLALEPKARERVIDVAITSGVVAYQD